MCAYRKNETLACLQLRMILSTAQLCQWCMARLSCLLLLLIKGKSVDQGWTALHIAAAKGERSVVRCLLGSGLFAVDDTDVQVGLQL